MSSDFFLDDKRLKKLDQELQQILDRDGVDRKTLDQVFDKPTLLSLGKLISDRVIATVDFPISTGKEANIFRASTPQKNFVAVKIYRVSTMTFKHIAKYIVGDPRFNCHNKSRRDIIYAWTTKEMKNLERLHQIKIPVPAPVKRLNNILVMEYIGDADQSAPLLKDVDVHYPQQLFTTLMDCIFQMYQKAGLVHADLSPYNVLMYKDKPYLIDLGQGVVLEHPMSSEFLKRDVHNIVHFFHRYGVKSKEQDLIDCIMRGERSW